MSHKISTEFPDFFTFVMADETFQLLVRAYLRLRGRKKWAKAALLVQRRVEDLGLLYGLISEDDLRLAS